MTEDTPCTRRPHFQLLSLAPILLILVSQSWAQRPPTPPINLNYLRVDFIQPGARPAALGGAFIGAAQDETAAPVNPAGLVFLKSAGASLHQRHARSDFDEPSGSFEDPDARANFQTINFNQTMAGIFVPLKRVTFAAFRNVAFDSRFNFETGQFLTIPQPLTNRQVLAGSGNFPGKSVDLDLEMVNDGVAAAVKLNRRLSIGATAKISVMNFSLNERTFLDPAVAHAGRLPQGNTAETTYSITTIEERNVQPSFSFGFNSALIVDKLFLGGVLNLNPTFKLTTNTFLPQFQFETGEVLPKESPPNRSFRMGIPDTYGLGLYYLVHNRLRFTFDLVQIEYTDLLTGNDLNLTADDELSPTGEFSDPDDMPDLTIDNALEVRFGMEYLLKVPELGLIPLRFGIHTVPGHRIYSANDDPDLQRLFPRQRDRTQYTFGLGIVFSSYLKFDGSADVSEYGLEFFGSTLVTIPF